eukprot:2227555-Pleurochrysis_carterae.AAC.1
MAPAAGGAAPTALAAEGAAPTTPASGGAAPTAAVAGEAAPIRYDTQTRTHQQRVEYDMSQY